MLNHDFCSCFLPFFSWWKPGFCPSSTASPWIFMVNPPWKLFDDSMPGLGLHVRDHLAAARRRPVGCRGSVGPQLEDRQGAMATAKRGKAPGFSERFSMKTIKHVGFPVSFRLQSNEVCGFIVQFYVSYAWCVSMFVETPWCSISWVHDVNICKK